MQELQAHAKHLQLENDQLRSHVEKNLELGKDVRDGDCVVRNKGKEPIISDDDDAPADDELSSRRSPSTNPPLGRNAQGSTRVKSRRKHSHRPTLSDAISGASNRAREKANKRQNQPLQAPRNASMLPDNMMPPMPPMHLTFGVGPTFYAQPTTLIRGPDYMLSSPLGQHILNYKPP